MESKRSRPPCVDDANITVSQNYGILVAFFLGFLVTFLAFTEFNASTARENTVVLFLRGFKKVASTADEEEGTVDEFVFESDKQTEEDALATSKPMTDIFTWRHLVYTIPTPEGDRTLLNDVSGYVKPGSLTALMGESGAGKTMLLSVLAQRNTSGIATGDRFINGYDLPVDFQAQT